MFMFVESWAGQRKTYSQLGGQVDLSFLGKPVNLYSEVQGFLYGKGKSL